MRRKVFRWAGIISAIFVLFVLASRYLTTDPNAFPSEPSPPNPLPECPASPNCVRVTWHYTVAPDALFEHAEAALRETGAATLDPDPSARRLDAVYNAFVFKDDVIIQVEPFQGQSALHLRSASRVGYSDLGVNERRVRAIQDALAARTR